MSDFSRKSFESSANWLQKGLIAPFAIAAVLAVAGTTLSSCDQKDGSASAAAAQAGPPAAVSVLTLHPQSVAVKAELSGRTSASIIAEVRPQVSGIIKARLFKEGSDVEVGDVLYEIDPAPYQAAFNSAFAAVSRAKANLPSAEAKLDRARNLNKQSVVAKETVEDAELAVAQAKADLEAAAAQLEAAKINVEYTKLRAPISGRIGKSTLTEGALVTAGQTEALATIRDLDTINVDVTRSSGELLALQQKIASGKIKVEDGAAKVRLRLDDGSLYTQEGVLAFAETAVDEGTGTYTLRATFPNPDRTLLPGMFVRAVVDEGTAEQSFLVPQRAVSRNAKGVAIASFVKADGTVETKVLDTKENVGNSWLVFGGLKDGDRLLVEGTMHLRPGAKVAPTEVSVDPDSGAAVSTQTSVK
jgi:membrane fusion protein (multidrug efflux system)